LENPTKVPPMSEGDITKLTFEILHHYNFKNTNDLVKLTDEFIEAYLFIHEKIRSEDNQIQKLLKND